ncbi:MAG: alpha/beta fold hydrolase, partial [Balneolales bacterium]|nr:alpha/beta fold hydrolase [Balneolales bacterium]
PSKKIEFTGAMGERLAARVDLPDEPAQAFALFAHCFTCSKDLRAVGNITRQLAKSGIATLRFDFTGLGESAGDFADTNFSSNIDDLIAACRFMENDPDYKAPDILIGHSLGGAAVLQAANQMPSVKAVATIGAPADPEHVKHNFEMSLEEIEEKGEAEVTLAGRKFTIKKQFVDDLEDTKMKTKIKRLGKALIIFHSPIDNTVGIENATKIFVNAKHPKSFISLDKADHLLQDRDDSEFVGKVVGTWAEKYI